MFFTFSTDAGRRQSRSASEYGVLVTHPVAHLPSAPVQLPDANDYQKVLEDNIISFSVAGALNKVRVVTWEWSLV